jgi:hypothetical protein
MNFQLSYIKINMADNYATIKEVKVMDMGDMWNTIKGQNAFGIEGYEIPRHYADPKKEIEKRNRAEIAKDALKHPKKYFPPRKNDEVIVFKRPNYLDDVYKWANSYYDKEKAEAVLEKINEKNSSLEPNGNNKPIPKIYKHDREFYTDQLIKNEKKNYDVYNFREDAITETRDKMNEFNAVQDKIRSDRLNGKFKADPKWKYNKIVGSLPKCDRVTVVADAEHVGEKLPFCPINPDIPKTIDTVDAKGRKKKVENFERFNYPKVSYSLI